MFYAKSTGGFYDAAIHGDNIPSDAVEITSDSVYESVKSPPEGKMLSSDENGYPVLIDIPVVVLIPQFVSRFQGRAALANAGHFTTVNNYMASLPVDNLQRLAWEDAHEFRRNSPTVAAMQALLNLSDAEIDDLFIEAATIEA